MFDPEIGSQEQNKGEQIASKMYEVLYKVRQPQNHENLNKAANEFSDENYDKGQRILEKNGFWHDTVREVAVEANQAERDKKGNMPLNFKEAKGAINGYAKSLAESGTREDKKSALAIESIVLGADMPGIEGVDETLKYIEGVLQTKAKSERKMTPEMKKEWDEQRAVRDALFTEKQRRIEKLQEKEQRGDRPTISEETIQKSKEQDEKELAGLRESLGLGEKKFDKLTAESVRLKLGLPELDLKNGTRAYDKNQGAASIFEVLKKINPDAQHLAQRIEELKNKFELVVKNERDSNPGKSKEAYENFASNKVFNELTLVERHTIENFLDSNYKKMGGSGQRLIAANGVFNDFIRLINKS